MPDHVFTEMPICASVPSRNARMLDGHVVTQLKELAHIFRK